MLATKGKGEGRGTAGRGGDAWRRRRRGANTEMYFFLILYKNGKDVNDEGRHGWNGEWQALWRGRMDGQIDKSMVDGRRIRCRWERKTSYGIKNLILFDGIIERYL